jgi:hypothetical protein
VAGSASVFGIVIVPGSVTLAGLASDVNVQRASGAYAGDGAGGGQAIACGFRPRAVFIVRKATDQFHIAMDPDGTDNEAELRSNGGGALVTLSTSGTNNNVNITATGFTVTSNANAAAQNFSWVAFR